MTAVTDWFIAHERDRYGWLDLLTGQLLGMQRDHLGVFCSEACAKALGLRNSHAHEPAGAAGCLPRYQQKRSVYLQSPKD
jgi:hypothetical protein